MQKLLELQRRINGSVNLVKPGRRLIRQGTLMRVSRGGSASYRRHFVLLSDTLLYCKGDPETSLTVCCLLPLNKCTVQRVLSGGLFRVTCLQESLLLYSESGDSEAWIQSLQEAVKKVVQESVCSTVTRLIMNFSVHRMPSDTEEGQQLEETVAEKSRQ